ncbi:MAG: cupin domain-containing protein [Gammaproteobacteria bacterium]|nr:cupin domain-containing protein [Gammaproteobacteria bacterium]MDE0414953.1 cupin domain-containing protein [Gammaproteobacteria bacterium]
MKTFALDFPNGEDRLKSLYSFTVGRVRLEFGTGFLKAGTRMPDHGVSAHSRREITLILEGELSTTSANTTARLKAGDIVTIPAGQEQSSIVHKDTRLIYFFFGP